MPGPSRAITYGAGNFGTEFRRGDLERSSAVIVWNGVPSWWSGTEFRRGGLERSSVVVIWNGVPSWWSGTEFRRGDLERSSVG